MQNILFITWDGPETNYIESLFSPIFSMLQEKYGYRFHIIQFTWGDKSRLVRTKKLCEEKKIAYHALRVRRKTPLSGILYALVLQSPFIVKYIKDNNIDVVMPRGTTSALLINKILKKIKASYLFDADGFSQDERVDFQGWNPLGLKYNLYRYFEFKSLHLADGILTRSHSAVKILESRAGELKEDKFTVITNGKDLNQFAFNGIVNRNTDGVRFIYVGSLGSKYLLEDMLAIFNSTYIVNPNSSFTILTGNVEYAKDMVIKHSINTKASIVIKSVDPQEVSEYVQNADVAFALIDSSFSMMGVAPIKLGEYLLSGVPVIASKGIGDTELYLQGSNAAFLIDNDNLDSKNEEIAHWALSIKNNSEYRKEARKIGETYFDIMKTVQLYNQAICKL